MRLTTAGALLAVAVIAAGCGGRGAPGSDIGMGTGFDGGLGAGAGAGLGGFGPGGAIGASTLPGTNIADRVFFAVDQSTLDDAAIATLGRQVGWLMQNPGMPILIEGHADERGTREYNIALSSRRAAAVRNYMVAQGIPDGRISTIPYGRERPVATCADESCWSQNRRAVTVVTGAPGV